MILTAQHCLLRGAARLYKGIGPSVASIIPYVDCRSISYQDRHMLSDHQVEAPEFVPVLAHVYLFTLPSQVRGSRLHAL